jgi:hypothetical protein
MSWFAFFSNGIRFCSIFHFQFLWLIVSGIKFIFFLFKAEFWLYIPIGFLDVPFREICLQISQISINFDQCYKFQWNTIKFKYFDIVQSPNARRFLLHMDMILIWIDEIAVIIQCLHVNSWYDML